MTRHDTNDSAGVRTNDDLDAALAALAAPVTISSRDLARLRERVFTKQAASVITIGRPRRRKIAIATAVLATCTVSGVIGAAASGVFDNQASTAFSGAATPGYSVDQSSVSERITTAMPDGGQAALYTASGTSTATGKKATCITVLFADPGVTPAGKPYEPRATCNPDIGSGSDITSGQDGWSWLSTKTRTRYSINYGHTDPVAVTATFTAPNGDKATTSVKDGYLLTFVGLTDPNQPYDGMSITNAAGHTTVLTQPFAPNPG